MSRHLFAVLVRILLLGFLGTIVGVSAATSLADFTFLNGQILTPGLAIVDSPQPFTPEGGDFLQVALDITNDGRLPVPPYEDGQDFETGFFNITIFLSSYDTKLNLTITNGTASAGNASLGDILFQEPKSSVKHVNWIWPECLVGNGGPEGKRGNYNITIQQNFRLNGTNFYTIFNLPIMVTNSIPEESGRPSCEELNNPLLADPLNGTSAVGSATFFNGTGAGTSTTPENGLGTQKPLATPGNGLGSGGASIKLDMISLCLCVAIGFLMTI